MRKRAISLFLAVVLAAATLPPAKAEAGSSTTQNVFYGLTAFTAFEVFLRPVLAGFTRSSQPVQAVVPVIQPTLYTPQQGTTYPATGTPGSGAGLTVANGTGFSFDLFINGRLERENLAPGDVVNVPIVGRGRILARTTEDGNRFAERSFSVNGDGTQVVLRARDFR